VGLHLARPAEDVLQHRLDEVVFGLRLVPGVGLGGGAPVVFAEPVEGGVGLGLEGLHVVALGEALGEVVVGEEASVVDGDVEERGVGHGEGRGVEKCEREGAASGQGRPQSGAIGQTCI